MFEHLSPEEQTQFKESIRTFRHPKFSKGVTEVILTDKENVNRSEKKAAQEAGQFGNVTSWLWSKLSQSIETEYDSTVSSPEHPSKCSSKTAASSTGSLCDKSVTCDDSLGYTTTNQRKKSFANHIKNNNLNPRMAAENQATKRHYSTTVNQKNDGGDKSNSNIVPSKKKIDEDFDPYEYASSQQKDLPEVTSGTTSAGVGLAGNVLQTMDFERETKRLEVAVDKVARRDQALQMACYKATFDPRRKYDDDDPNFKEEKKYFDDELNPLREVKNEKDLKTMSVKEIVSESLASFKERANPRRVLADGGEQALKDGQRFRTEYKVSEKRVGALLILIVVIFGANYALDTGLIEFRSPSDEFLEQAIQERQVHSQKENRIKDN